MICQAPCSALDVYVWFLKAFLRPSQSDIRTEQYVYTEAVKCFLNVHLEAFFLLSYAH